MPPSPDYTFLVPAFLKLWKEMVLHPDVHKLKNSWGFYAFCEHLNVSQEEGERLIRKLAERSGPNDTWLTEALTLASFEFSRQPLSFRVEAFQPINDTALHWFTLHCLDILKRLDVFPEYELFIAGDDRRDDFKMLHEFSAFKPYQQCFLCGRIGTDLRGRPIRTWCHRSSNRLGNECITTSTDGANASNPENHHPDCCYRRWELKKKGFRQDCDRIMDGTIPKGYPLPLEEKRERIVEMFMETCKEVYTTISSKNEQRVNIKTITMSP